MPVRPENHADRPIDALSVALEELRAHRGRFYASRVPRPWGLRFAATEGCVFHVLRHGAGDLWIGGQRVPLVEGELVLLPHGEAHALGERPDGWPAVFPEQASVRRDWAPGSDDVAEVVCGEVSLREGVALPLRAALPTILRVPADGPVGGVLALLLAEAGEDRPGSAALVTRLVEVLVVHAVRRWAETDAGAPGWVKGARDPVVGRALAAIHADPAADWSVAALARVSGSSRSRFAERFTALLGVPPLTWVQRVRLTAAAAALGAEGARVSEVAARWGYASPAAFSRAFKRVMGVAPRTLRAR